MVLVAADARTLEREEMKPALEFNFLFDLNVTCKALRAADFLATLVTLGAVRNSFQCGMGSR
jgi:hypothetical protein